MQRRQNNAVHGPRGALLALQNVDFERLRDSGLQATVVLYLSIVNVWGTMTARYEGAISRRHYSPDLAPTLSDLALPQATYRKYDSNDFQKNVPASTLFGPPSYLEFSIYARNAQEYQGMTAFRDVLVPALLQVGYTQTNSTHTSVFWLHAGKDTPKGEGYVLCIDSIDGLTIGKTEVDGVHLFTEQDVKRFMDLKMG